MSGLVPSSSDIKLVQTKTLSVCDSASSGSLASLNASSPLHPCFPDLYPPSLNSQWSAFTSKSQQDLCLGYSFCCTSPIPQPLLGRKQKSGELLLNVRVSIWTVMVSSALVDRIRCKAIAYLVNRDALCSLNFTLSSHSCQQTNKPTNQQGYAE